MAQTETPQAPKTTLPRLDAVANFNSAKVASEQVGKRPARVMAHVVRVVIGGIIADVIAIRRRQVQQTARFEHTCNLADKSFVLAHVLNHLDAYRCIKGL